MRGTSCLFAILLLPLAAATPPCECWAEGEAQDAAGDAPIGSDIVGVRWGTSSREIVIEARGGIHTDLRWQVVLWTHVTGDGGGPREARSCFTVHPSNGTILLQESGGTSSAATCTGEARVLRTPATIRGGEALAFVMESAGHAVHPDNGRTCSALHVQVWRGDELLDETVRLPERGPANKEPCSGSTKTHCYGHCTDFFVASVRTGSLVVALTLLALLRRR